MSFLRVPNIVDLSELIAASTATHDEIDGGTKDNECYVEWLV